MKTLYISYFGAQKHLSHSQILPYLRQLAQAGVEVTLITFEERPADPTKEKAALDKLRADLSAAGIDWHWLRYHKTPTVPATAFDAALGTLLGGYLILRKRIDVVHARGHVPGLMALALKTALRVKVLFDLRGLMAEEYVEAGRWSPGGRAFRATKWVERQLFQKADAIVMLTNRAVRTLRAGSPELQQNPAAVQVIPCCVDLDKFRPPERAPLRRRFGWGGKTVMVYVGSLGGWYLSEELARLFATGRTLIPNLHFLVLTQSPHDEMRTLLRAEGVPDDAFTIATASPKEMPEYLAAADFGVHFIRPGVSMIANSPTKFGEYLASGLPILTNTGIGDSDEIVGGERVGVIVDEFTPAAYRAGLTAMQKLLADPGTVAHCRAVAERRFSLRGVGRASYLSIYRTLGLPADVA